MAHIIVNGNMTADPTFGTNKEGKDYVSFSIAHESYIRDRDGGRKDDTPVQYYNIYTTNSAVVQSMERNETIGKGTRLIVSGNVTFDSYVTRDGEERDSFSIYPDFIGVDLVFSDIVWSRPARPDEDDEPARTSRTKKRAKATPVEDDIDEDEDEVEDKPASRRASTTRGKTSRAKSAPVEDEDDEVEDKPASRRAATGRAKTGRATTGRAKTGRTKASAADDIDEMFD